MFRINAVDRFRSATGNRGGAILSRRHDIVALQQTK
jgi:hypothetical protein